MAGSITISTLNNDTGVLATQNGMTGIAKAWVNFNGGAGNTPGVINGSFNVSSATRNSAGNYTINYTIAMPNANYVPVFGGNRDANPTNAVSLCAFNTPATSSITFITGNSNFQPIDYDKCYIAVFSS
jgi:hypothetical protein